MSRKAGYEHDEATKIGKATMMRRMRRASSESSGLAIWAGVVMVVADKVLDSLQRVQRGKTELHASQADIRIETLQMEFLQKNLR